MEMAMFRTRRQMPAAHLPASPPPPVVMDKRIHPGRLQRVSPVWERRSA